MINGVVRVKMRHGGEGRIPRDGHIEERGLLG